MLVIDKQPEGTKSPNLADAVVVMCYWPVDRIRTRHRPAASRSQEQEIDFTRREWPSLAPQYDEASKACWVCGCRSAPLLRDRSLTVRHGCDLIGFGYYLRICH